MWAMISFDLSEQSAAKRNCVYQEMEERAWFRATPTTTMLRNSANDPKMSIKELYGELAEDLVEACVACDVTLVAFSLLISPYEPM